MSTADIRSSVAVHCWSIPRYFAPWQVTQACSLGLNVCPTSPFRSSSVSFGAMWQATHSTRTWNMWLGIIGVP